MTAATRCRTCEGRPRPAPIRPVVGPTPGRAPRPELMRLTLPSAEARVRQAVLGLYERLGWAVHVAGKAADIDDDRTRTRFLVRSRDGRHDRPAGGRGRR